MSEEMARLIVNEFNFSEELFAIFNKNIRSLNRQERMQYYKFIKPQERSIIQFILNYYKRAPVPLKYRIVSQTVDNMYINNGDPNIVDSVVMNAVGRILVYKRLREKSESEGSSLAALNSFRGTYLFLIILLIAMVVIVYFYSS